MATVTSQTYAASRAKLIDFKGFGGDDSFSNNSAIPSRADGGTGSDTLRGGADPLPISVPVLMREFGKQSAWCVGGRGGARTGHTPRDATGNAPEAVSGTRVAAVGFVVSCERAVQ